MNITEYLPTGWRRTYQDSSDFCLFVTTYFLLYDNEIDEQLILVDDRTNEVYGWEYYSEQNKLSKINQIREALMRYEEEQ